MTSATPREIAIAAACHAGMGAIAAIAEPASLRAPTDAKAFAGLFDILDYSPDLPASAIAKQLQRPDMPIAAAEAIRATYAGMQPWVKAEEARAAAEKEAAKRARSQPRGDAYEKSGKEERGGKVFAERTGRR